MKAATESVARWIASGGNEKVGQLPCLKARSATAAMGGGKTMMAAGIKCLAPPYPPCMWTLYFTA